MNMDTELLADSLPVEAAITSDNIPLTILARMAVSTMHVEFLKLINVELKRAEHPADFLEALTRYFVQMHAAIAAQTVDASCFGAAASMIIAIVDDEYEDHARKVAAHVELGR